MMRAMITLTGISPRKPSEISHLMVAIRRRFPGADINEPDAAALREMKRHLRSFFDVEKIAPLLAIGVLRTIALEESDDAALPDLLEGFRNDAAHLALVLFVGPENIKILDAANALEPSLPLRVAIEEVLRIGIGVHRAQRR